MMNSDLISVIIPAYNCQDVLQRSVQSVLNQTYQNLEIILVDDGSTDDTFPIAQMLAQQDGRIKLYSQQNKGVSATRNRAVQLATGKYIGFVDADDWVEPNMFEVLYHTIKEYDAEISCCGRWDHPSEKISYTLPQPTVYTNKEAIRSFLLTDTIGGSFWEKLYCRELFSNIDFEVSYLPDDFLIVYQLMKKAKRVAHCGQALYHYIYYSYSISHAKYTSRLLGYGMYSKQLYDDAIISYPEFQKEALSLFLYKTLFVCYLCVKDGGSQQDRRYYHQLLQPYLSDILTNAYLPIKYKAFGMAEFLSISKPLIKLIQKTDDK